MNTASIYALFLINTHRNQYAVQIIYNQPHIHPADFIVSSLALIQLLLSSYRQLLGHDLIPATDSLIDAAAWLQHEAPFCVLARC